jgi:hypothetical protein
VAILTAAAGVAAAAAERASVVAITGQATPGIPGTVFNRVDVPAVNGLGQVTFRTSIKGNGVSSDTDDLLWVQTAAGLRRVLREGETAPGVPTDVFGDDLQPTPTGFNDFGQVAFSTGLLHAGANGNFFGTVGDWQRVAVGFTSYPSPYTYKWSGFVTTGVNARGQLVVADSGNSFWTGTSVASLAPVLTSKSAVPGIPSVRGFDSAYSFAPLLNDAGAIVAEAGIRNASNDYAGHAVFGGTSAASVTKLAYQGDAVPAMGAGYVLSRVFGSPSLNRDGQVVLRADLTTPSSGTVRGIFLTGVAGAPLTPAVLGTDAAPGFAAGVTFQSFGNSVLSGDGSIFFSSTLDRGGASPNESTIWRRSPSGALSLVFDAFAPSVHGLAPGTTAYGIAQHLVTNDAGQLAFPGVLQTPGGGSARAVFGFDPSVGAVVLAAVGGTIELAPGDVRTLADINPSIFGGLGRGSPHNGYATVLNDAGVLVYQATFTDLTQAILATRIPVAGDTNQDGIVDRTDVRNLLTHLGRPGSRSDGDFDLDGVVTFTDYQILEQNFGRHHPIIPEVAIASELSAPVPEPITGLVLPLVSGFVTVARRPTRRRLS